MLGLIGSRKEKVGFVVTEFSVGMFHVEHLEASGARAHFGRTFHVEHLPLTLLRIPGRLHLAQDQPAAPTPGELNRGPPLVAFGSNSVESVLLAEKQANAGHP
jgi:hypothetical protein